MLGNAGSQLLRLTSNLVLTRLLVPETFGLMSVVIVLMVGLNMLADTGTHQAIIRSPNAHQPAFRRTVWTVQIARGLVLAIVVLLMAFGLWLAQHQNWMTANSTYAHPDLPALMAAYAFCPIVHGFMSTKLAWAQRELRNRDTVINSLVGQLIAVPVTIVMASHWPSVWTLMAGIWVSTTVQTLSSHWLINGPSDAIGWDRTTLLELRSFGRWVMVSSWLGFFAISSDRLMLSGLISAHDLGLYALAFLLINAIDTVFSMVASQVAFPALSEVNLSRRQDLPAVYQKFQRLFDFIVGISAGTLAFCSPALIALMYDARYQGVVSMVQILCVGLVGMRFQVMEQVYLAVGRPSLLSLAHGMRMLLMCLAVVVGHHVYGVHGAVAGVAIAPFASWFIAIYFRRRLNLPGLLSDLLLIPSLGLGAAFGYVITIVLNNVRQFL